MKECQAPKEKNSPPTIDSQACDVSFKESTTSSNLYNGPVLEFFLQQCKLQEIRNHLLLPCFFQVFLKNKQFKPLLGLGSYQKKAIADEEKGEAGTWANFSKAASRLGKSVWSPQSDSSWWRWKFAAAKLFAWGIMGMLVVSGGFFSEHVFFLKTKNVMLLPRCGEVFGVSVSSFHSFLLLIW